jgi:glyoxylase-like metal-dependent hydrolase (beta-lactamase superfamily II)
MRAIKNLFVLVIIVAILGGIGAVALRIARGKASGVEEVKQGIVVSSSVSSYVYGAKVGNKVILFDAGADPGGAPVDAVLGWLHAARSDVTDVFVTHGHGDHTAGISGLGSPHVHIGAGDLALAEKKVPPEALAGKAFTAVMSYPAIAPGDPITGPTTFDVGQGADAKKVKAFPIPGHTAGSYAYLYDGVLFVGDAMIFKQGRLDPAIKLFDAHPDDNKASIRKLQKLVENEEIDIVCTGHGGCTPKGLGRNQLTDLVARL